MFSKLKLGLSNSVNVVSLIILAVTILLVFAGFVRIEIKLNEQETKLAVVEQICIERTPNLSSELKGKKVILVFYSSRAHTVGCVNWLTLFCAAPWHHYINRPSDTL